MSKLEDYDSILNGLIDVWCGKVSDKVSNLNMVSSAARLIQDMKKELEEKDVLILELQKANEVWANGGESK